MLKSEKRLIIPDPSHSSKVEWELVDLEVSVGSPPEADPPTEEILPDSTINMEDIGDLGDVLGGMFGLEEDEAEERHADRIFR